MTLDAVGLEVMGHAFASVAEEMGLLLIHSAVSPNIRERRDCSAALFDAAGEMIAQAAHIPVHLGALHESVAVVRTLGPGPGELFILNDPYSGGSHLPDITLVGAIEVDGTVGGYSVVRAHHSDVGGVQAGSMPAGAREIFAEGVIVPPLRLTGEVERLLLANVRTAETRRADLAAQRAAVARGAEGLRALATRYGWGAVREAATDLLDYAERRAREALGRRLAETSSQRILLESLKERFGLAKVPRPSLQFISDYNIVYQYDPGDRLEARCLGPDRPRLERAAPARRAAHPAAGEAARKQALAHRGGRPEHAERRAATPLRIDILAPSDNDFPKAA